MEISAGIDVILDYKQKKLKTLDLINLRFEKCKKYFNVIRFLFHQWVFNSKDNLGIVQKNLVELKKDPCLEFKLLEDI